MQKGDVIRARFLTMPDPFPCSGKTEKQYPVRKATVVYVHPKGRYIVAECKGVRETFFMRTWKPKKEDTYMVSSFCRHGLV